MLLDLNLQIFHLTNTHISSERSSPFCWLYHFLISNTISIDFRPLGCTCGVTALISVCLHNKSLVQCRPLNGELTVLRSQPSLEICHQKLLMFNKTNRCYFKNIYIIFYYYWYYF